MSTPYDPQEEPKSIDGMAGSSKPIEVLKLEVVEDEFLLTDAEIMEILIYAAKVNK